MAFRLVPAEQVLGGTFSGKYILGGTGTYLQSPDYVPGVSGWAIFADGSAEFNSGTFRGLLTATEFDGTDFVIDSDGEFFYGATPAAGNLILAIANAAGTDIYSNPYKKGLMALGIGADAGAYVWLDPALGRVVVQSVLAGYQAVCDGGSLTMSTPGSVANPATYATQDAPLASIIQSPSDGANGSAELKLYAGTASAGPFIQAQAPLTVAPGDGNVYDTACLHGIVDAAQGITAAAADIIGMSGFGVSAGGNYRVHGVVHLVGGSASETYTITFASTGGFGSGGVNRIYTNAVLVGAPNYGNITFGSGSITMTIGAGATAYLYFDGEVNISAAGNFGLTVKAGTLSGTPAIEAGSFIDLMPVT